MTTRRPAATIAGRAAAYRELADSLEARIRDGEWAPGDRFPSLREMWRWPTTGGETTVKEASRVLRERGLVVAVPGRGTFVVDPLPEPGGPADLSARVASLEERVAALEEGRGSG